MPLSKGRGGRRVRARVGVAVLASLVGVLLLSGCTTSEEPTSRPASSTTAAVVPPRTNPAGIDSLEVAQTAANVAPYRRDAFGGDWAYDPISGCNIRERVLIEESLVPAVVDDRCHPSSGQWVSAYDGITTQDPADLQIDHFIPLANAWRSGAATWTPERRLAFANDLTSPLTLIAVYGRTNESKSDSTPDQWLPPDKGAWCTYAKNWVTVKSRWTLTVTPPEKATLVRILNDC